MRRVECAAERQLRHDETNGRRTFRDGPTVAGTGRRQTGGEVAGVVTSGNPETRPLDYVYAHSKHAHVKVFRVTVA